MKCIAELRKYAAKRHADVPQIYEPGIPYWIHLLVCELVALAFGLSIIIRRSIVGHDLKEDTFATEAELIEAGFRKREADNIEGMTDEPGETRAEKKKKTLPKTRRFGREAIAGKLCDRAANLIWGILTGNVRSHTRYQLEQAQFEEYLFDAHDTELLPLWNFVRSLLAMTPRLDVTDKTQTTLYKLARQWVAREKQILSAKSTSLRPEWHKVSRLLNEHA